MSERSTGRLVGVSVALALLVGGVPLVAATAEADAKNYPTRAELRAAVVRPPAPVPAPAIEHLPRDPRCLAGIGAGWFEPERYTVVLCWPDRFVREHELGHAFDMVMLDDYERTWFRDLIDQEGRPWWTVGSDGLYTHTSPGESFADAYAHCRLRTVFVWRTRKGALRTVDDGSADYYPRTNFQHRRVCRFIDRAAMSPGQPARAE